MIGILDVIDKLENLKNYCISECKNSKRMGRLEQDPHSSGMCQGEMIAFECIRIKIEEEIENMRQARKNEMNLDDAQIHREEHE